MSYCCNSSSILSRVGKESKLWKEQFIIEKNCRKVLEDWILRTFGFDVKLDYEKDTNVARIQAIENKEEMKCATFPNESAEGEMKVVVMDIKMPELEDIYEMEDVMGTEPESQSQIQIPHQIHQQRLDPSEVTQMVTVGPSPVTEYPVVSHQQGQYQQLQQHGVPIEIATAGDTMGGEQIVYLGNYDDGNASGGQPSYYILKSDGGDGEEIPVQFDYSTFINGDVATLPSSTEKVFYRIATPGETGIQVSGVPTLPTEPEPVIPVTSEVPKKAAKRKSQPPKNPGSKAAKAKKPAQSKASKVKKYNIIIDPDPENVNSASTNVTSPKSKKDTPTKSSSEKHKLPLEFGLTLREKAEIYVRTKAKEATRKVGSGYECSLCPNGNYSYSSQENAITHTKSHFEDRPYRCESCNGTFGVQRELLLHRKTSHPKPKGSEHKSPMKPAVMYSQQYAAQSQPKQVVVKTAIIVPPSPNVQAVTPPVAVAKSIKPISTPKDSKKQFKCQIDGCLWSYASAEELGWHMKAHSQARV